MNSSFEVSTGQRQLFLDDAGIAEVRNLTRTLHQPQKRGAVVRSSKPHQTIQTVSTPVWDPDEKLFKFWVIGTDESYRISLDGLHWTAGPKQTNGVSMAVRDPNDPNPKYRYKAALGNDGFAVSPNGINWTKLDVPAIPSFDEYNFSYNPTENLFIHTVKRDGPYGDRWP